MALTLSVPKSQLDFNHNGIFDAATEGIYKTTETVGNAFIGVDQLGGGYSTSANTYKVIPEPMTMSLLIGGAVVAFLTKRVKDYFRLA